MSSSDFPPPPPGFGQGVPEQEPHSTSPGRTTSGRVPASTGSANHGGSWGAASPYTSAQMYVAPEHGFYSPVAAVKSCLQNYARFRGRASRSQFWWFFAFWQLVYTGGAALDTALGFSPVATATQSAASNAGPVATAVGAALLIPLFAVFSRRMHDVGRSGLYIFWIFTVIGTIWVLVRLCQSGGANVDNGYGVRT